MEIKTNQQEHVTTCESCTFSVFRWKYRIKKNTFGLEKNLFDGTILTDTITLGFVIKSVTF